MQSATCPAVAGMSDRAATSDGQSALGIGLHTSILESKGQVCVVRCAAEVRVQMGAERKRTCGLLRHVHCGQCCFVCFCS